jgi:hypothetical protein
VSAKHLLDRTESAAIRIPRNCVGPFGIGIHDSDQPHKSGFLQLLIDPGVIAPEGSDSDDGDVDGRGWIRRIFVQISAPAACGTRYCRSFVVA